MLKLIQLFWIFFKVGLFSFGGGYAMLPMIYQEIKNFGLMPAKEFSDLVALSQMTPGPIAVNAATYVGFRSAGFWGSVFATIGVSLPSFIIILIISAFFYRFKSSTIISSILSGIRPASVGMITSAVIFFAKTSIVNMKAFGPDILKHPLGFISIPAIIIFTLTVIGTKKFKIGPIPLTIAAGVLGAFIM